MFLLKRLFNQQALNTNVVSQPLPIDLDEVKESRVLTESSTNDVEDDELDCNTDDNWDDDWDDWDDDDD